VHHLSSDLIKSHSAEMRGRKVGKRIKLHILKISGSVVTESAWEWSVNSQMIGVWGSDLFPHVWQQQTSDSLVRPTGPIVVQPHIYWNAGWTTMSRANQIQMKWAASHCNKKNGICFLYLTISSNLSVTFVTNAHAWQMALKHHHYPRNHITGVHPDIHAPSLLLYKA
jgi:hypothetical protein